MITHHKPQIITMAKVKGSKINADTIAPRCIKYLKALEKKTIDLENIGDRKNNAFLDLIRCQVRAKKSECKSESKMYENCHASVMGVGAFEGRKNCGKELDDIYKCILPP